MIEPLEVMRAVIQAAEAASKLHDCRGSGKCPWCEFEKELKDRLRFLDMSDDDQD